MSLSLHVGIDLGTTNSAIAVCEAGRARVLPDGDGHTLLPSAVHADATGTLHVGRVAIERSTTAPADTALEFKRLMGTNERVHFPASGTRHRPEALSASVLRTLLTRLPAGETCDAAVITVPAMFQLPQCEATQRAAKEAGLAYAPLLQEPIAAAIAYAGSARMRDGYWLVYDLGGGTFDATLVRSRAGRLVIEDHDGDNQLGGKDLDRAVARRAIEAARSGGKLGEFKRSDPRFATDFARIRAESERVRVALSDVETVTFRVERLGGEVDLEFQMDRGEFEALAAPAIDRTAALCKAILERNRVRPTELHGVVLVGGPTQTPFVAGHLKAALGCEALHVGDPMLMVAQGAALFASTLRKPEALVKRPANALALHLEYEAMTTDRSPLLSGKVLGEAANLRVCAKRSDGWTTPEGSVRSDGVFALPLELVPQALNVFTFGMTRDGAPVVTHPDGFSILHGVALARAPLSESVGVLLANNEVAWHLRKGSPLPARETLALRTTIPLAAGSSGTAVEVPVVQGESERGDRNKVVGILRIRAEGIPEDLPAGAEVRVTLAVDESSRTTATAFVPLLNLTFDEVVQFGVESKAGTEVTKDLAEQQKRIAELAELAGELEANEGPVDARVKEIEELIEEGDRDSVELADKLVRRMGRSLDKAESSSKLTRIAEEYKEWLAEAQNIVRAYGDDAEKRELAAIVKEYERAVAAVDERGAERRVEMLRDLTFRLLHRQPDYWRGMARNLAKKVREQGLGASAGNLLSRADNCANEGSITKLNELCIALWELLPSNQKGLQEAPSRIVTHVYR